jgi:dTDP-D-glucose 4,6-dehydratase
MISARNQDIIMVYEAVIKVDIYGVGLANTRAQLYETDALFMVSLVAKPVEFGSSYNFESLGSVIV